MSEDIFDIVDENDNVFASAPRSEVHAKNLAHRAVHVLIFSAPWRGNRKILLQKRSAKKDNYPLVYTTSCSGHVDSGETYETAVVRELAEETGLSLPFSEMDFVGKISACPETGNEFTKVWSAEIDENRELSFSPDEIDSFEWLEVDAFKKAIAERPCDFTPSFVKVFGFYLSKQK